MALTRPRLGQFDTTVSSLSDPITVLHGGSTTANVDVGFLMNRANGLVSNVALYWNESGNTFVTAFTSNSGSTDSNITATSYANITVGSLLINGGIVAKGTYGNAGEVLTSTGSGSQWAAGGGFNGGTIGNPLTINNSTSSTSTTTGALIVAGGAGIAGSIVYGTSAVLTSSSITTSIGASPALIDSFQVTAYRSAKYIVSVTDVTNTGYQTTEITLMQDGTYANIATYGIVYSGASAKMTFSSNVVAGSVNLWGTGISANNTVKLVRTLIPV